VGLFSRRGGENYGWNVTEGNHCFSPPAGCSTAGQTLPPGGYSHGDGCSVPVRSSRLDNGRAVDQRDWTSVLSRGVDALSSFGVDADGEVYILDHTGEVYKIVPAG